MSASSVCFAVVAFVVVVRRAAAQAHPRCGASTNLFTAQHVIDSFCAGQTSGTSTSVRDGTLCGTCAGSCEADTRLCFRASHTCSFNFRSPVRIDAVVAWVTLRKVRQITAFTLQGETVAQMVFNVAAKVDNDDWYLAPRVQTSPMAVRAVQVQMFNANDAQQAAVSRIILCGAPVAVVTAAPTPALPSRATPALFTSEPSSGESFTVIITPDAPPALPLGAIVGIAVGGAVCLLLVCVVVAVALRAHRNARSFTLSSRNWGTPRRPPMRSSGVVDSGAAITMLPVGVDPNARKYDHVGEEEGVDRYKLLQMSNDSAASYDQVVDPDVAARAVADSGVGFGYVSGSSNAPPKPAF